VVANVEPNDGIDSSDWRISSTLLVVSAEDSDGFCCWRVGKLPKPRSAEGKQAAFCCCGSGRMPRTGRGGPIVEEEDGESADDPINEPVSDDRRAASDDDDGELCPDDDGRSDDRVRNGIVVLGGPHDAARAQPLSS